MIFSPCFLEWFSPEIAGKKWDIFKKMSLPNEHLSSTKNFQATTNFSLSSLQNDSKIPNPPWNLHINLSFLFYSPLNESSLTHIPLTLCDVDWIKPGVRVPNYGAKPLEKSSSWCPWWMLFQVPILYGAALCIILSNPLHTWLPQAFFHKTEILCSTLYWMRWMHTYDYSWENEIGRRSAQNIVLYTTIMEKTDPCHRQLWGISVIQRNGFHGDWLIYMSLYLSVSLSPLICFPRAMQCFARCVAQIRISALISKSLDQKHFNSIQWQEMKMYFR